MVEIAANAIAAGWIYDEAHTMLWSIGRFSDQAHGRSWETHGRRA
jgi:hypothetical protein